MSHSGTTIFEVIVVCIIINCCFDCGDTKKNLTDLESRIESLEYHYESKQRILDTARPENKNDVKESKGDK